MSLSETSSHSNPKFPDPFPGKMTRETMRDDAEELLNSFKILKKQRKHGDQTKPKIKSGNPVLLSDLLEGPSKKLRTKNKQNAVKEITENPYNEIPKKILNQIQAKSTETKASRILEDSSDKKNSKSVASNQPLIKSKSSKPGMNSSRMENFIRTKPKKSQKNKSEDQIDVHIPSILRDPRPPRRGRPSEQKLRYIDKSEPPHFREISPTFFARVNDSFAKSPTTKQVSFLGLKKSTDAIKTFAKEQKKLKTGKQNLSADVEVHSSGNSDETLKTISKKMSQCRSRRRRSNSISYHDARKNLSLSHTPLLHLIDLNHPFYGKLRLAEPQSDVGATAANGTGNGTVSSTINTNMPTNKYAPSKMKPFEEYKPPPKQPQPIGNGPPQNTVYQRRITSNGSRCVK